MPKIINVIDNKRVTSEKHLDFFTQWVETNVLNPRQDKLWENYTPDRLKLKEHERFDILFTDDLTDIISFTGVFNGGRYPDGVLRFGNRAYVNKKFRSFGKKVAGWGVDTLIPYQINQMTPHFWFGFVSMQSPHKAPVLKSLAKKLDKSTHRPWTFDERYFRVCNAEVVDCYQRIIYASKTNSIPEDIFEKVLDEESYNQRFTNPSL